jgi:hypothetical protein
MDKLLNKYNKITGEDELEALAVADFDDELKEDVLAFARGKSCCHTDESWELISTGTDNHISMDVPPTGLKLHGDPCYYFRIKIEGEWGSDAADNSVSVDFTTNPIWVQFLTRTNESSAWTKSRSKQYNYSSGNTIAFTEEFNFISDTDLFIAPNLSRYDDATLTDVIHPIQNWSRFWMKITVTKCPRTSWFNTYSIPPDGPNGTSVKQGLIPVSASEGLPFDGWYEVNARVQVTEEVAVGGTPASLTDPQKFELRGVTGTWYEVDRSPTHIPVTPPNQDAVMGHSLQGSIFLYVSNPVTGSRDIEYRVTLPNGAYKTLVEGYAHIKYLGKTKGISSKD